MEPKSQQPASLGTIAFMVAAVVFAAVAGILISQFMENTFSKEPVKQVIVAARNVPSGQLLRQEDIKIAYWPQSSVPQGAFQKSEEILHSSRVPLISFVQGEAILTSHMSKPNAGLGIAPLVEPDKRAMSIVTDNAVALARLVYPSARVDVLVTMREASSAGSEATVTTRVLLQNVKVLAVGEDIDLLSVSRRRGATRGQNESGAFSSPTEDSREARGVVTLMVSPEEAERLALASREGKIDLVLRHPQDSRRVSTPGATPTRFMSEALEEQRGNSGAGTRAVMSLGRRSKARRSSASSFPPLSVQPHRGISQKRLSPRQTSREESRDKPREESGDSVVIIK